MPPAPSSAAAITRRRRALETAVDAWFNNDKGEILTDSAVAALVLCLEEFLRQLSQELADEAPPASSSALRQVTPHDVSSALCNLGFKELSKESTLVLQQHHNHREQTVQPRKQVKKRKMEFSQEDAEAQERLLLASKQRMGENKL